MNLDKLAELFAFLFTDRKMTGESSLSLWQSVIDLFQSLWEWISASFGSGDTAEATEATDPTEATAE